MWFVYILLCRGGSLYTGIAKDPAKRFREHAIGRGGAYTRSHPPDRIVYQETRHTRADALRREATIKRLTKKKKLRIISG